MIELKSSAAVVKIKSKGAELCSFKSLKTNVEYVWQADPEVWGRHAPVLFPIVGQVEDGEYFVDDERYELSQHGFARDKAFEIVSQSDTQVVFSLKFDEDTLKKYPYKFQLDISYTLDEASLKIGYEVRNLDDKELLFQLGAHPGFTCPFNSGDSFSDYKLVFDKPLNEDRLLFDDGLLNGEISKDFMNNQDTITLDDNTFDNDAIIFETDQIESVLITKDGQTGLEVDVTGWPLLGIWSKPKANAPYVCIEPWFGVASVRGESKELKDKKAIQKLASGAVFNVSFDVTIK